MTSTKHILLAAALVAFAAPAFASDGDNGPFLAQGLPQVFQQRAPRPDVGSEAYPASVGVGTASAGEFTNHVLRDHVPAYQRGFDVGSETYPELR